MLHILTYNIELLRIATHAASCQIYSLKPRGATLRDLIVRQYDIIILLCYSGKKKQLDGTLRVP